MKTLLYSVISGEIGSTLFEVNEGDIMKKHILIKIASAFAGIVLVSACAAKAGGNPVSNPVMEDTLASGAAFTDTAAEAGNNEISDGLMRIKGGDIQYEGPDGKWITIGSASDLQKVFAMASAYDRFETPETRLRETAVPSPSADSDSRSFSSSDSRGSDARDYSTATPETSKSSKTSTNTSDNTQIIRGEKGEKGDTGATGKTGATGAKGEKGDKGDTGAAGKDGKDGKDGTQVTIDSDGQLVLDGVGTGYYLTKKESKDKKKIDAPADLKVEQNVNGWYLTWKPDYNAAYYEIKLNNQYLRQLKSHVSKEKLADELR